MGDPIQLDPAAVLEAVEARAGQTYVAMLNEIGRLTAYCQQLQTELAALKASGDAWGDKPE